MHRAAVLVGGLFLFLSNQAFANNDQPVASSLPAEDSENLPTHQPDLIGIGAGSVDFDKPSSVDAWKNDSKVRTTDVRLEYRFGYALAEADASWVDFGVHPLIGASGTWLGQYYGFAGFDFDAVFLKHIVVTESEAVGAYDSGNARYAKPMGSTVEFRSQAEIGWRFDDDIRLTGDFSHISNAGLTRRNPGQEIVGGYLYIPVGFFFGH